MEGVRKAISDRVNARRHPARVSRVGEDKIRVQVPGVKDPEKLIKTSSSRPTWSSGSSIDATATCFPRRPTRAATAN